MSNQVSINENLPNLKILERVFLGRDTEVLWIDVNKVDIKREDT
ncbi:hypothetical protein N4845_10760 [Enterococcus faecalis]|nr:hypothetical protein [Enterococcus faecalis]MCU9763777.1 hypothetical protein [Enterococcus faecalis]